jgi:hypothetical protein
MCVLFQQALSPPVASEKRIKATDAATRVSATAVLSWNPGITLGAYQETICFVLSQVLKISRALPLPDSSPPVSLSCLPRDNSFLSFFPSPARPVGPVLSHPKALDVFL